ncbi:NADH-quinone oxidoreductase subunit NuoF [Shewanella sp. D64]|uniref:NADH-quinone oxidoreductase subunit NuoF n=1 Tax=unclassified Shewanella TaxID=196818 RepID=UPI0022BA1C48|nr:MULTISPECIES: NADH-quinone oxidoreductase subunit NuoF [unclassified Shewanella]MEC4724775.1 NADH-quinone oxidoreductase subunit NuoF [Shewanella sp. D64]MEC4736431.1 NADH-quinone oxidoreductase subunit NuoF [Shewanella sp. E94]WBJ97511.1 NADH-quinone oxidoreductase subunit NuoF [Shewanella sp. MTB7]
MSQTFPHNPLTRFITSDETSWCLEQYQAHGGYQGFRKSLDMSQDQLLDTLKESNLRGRGGAGFPTGLKWSFVPRGNNAPSPRYLIVNADEMEPGVFKDRMLLEKTPHQIIEGLLVGAQTLGASIGYIFLRGDYYLAEERLTQALNECRAANLLGQNILGSELNFDIHLHTSAGRYICGEETALINSMEGKRATPRAKPPFPQVAGLWGKPTIVNNVETFCNLPHIINFGPQWFKELGLEEDAGTKIFGVSGRVNNPGLWELPMGTPIREIIEQHAGGMCDGYSLKGFLPGGGSTDFLVTEHLDVPMDYDAIGKQGSRMGTGTIIILDDKYCPVSMVLNLIKFFAQESCGWCTPCRDGLPWAQVLLEKIESGEGELEDITQLEELCRFAAPGNTFCALAPGAVEPLQSALNYFKKDFESHITQACCPFHVQQDLKLDLGHSHSMNKDGGESHEQV